MVSSDPISDMLTRIRNAIAVRKNEVRMPHSGVKESVAKVLADNKYLQSVVVDDSGVFKELVIKINEDTQNATITEIERVSRPGRRVYMGSSELPQVKQGRGLLIVSTSKGVMTGANARKERLGGEVICKVY
ncbi:30S ribosomal protein S8 [Candidatus Saccharibacteria bacterium]|jgi:small subunit ribosomal protein S8|nr:MAG: 30S ribosomal protein S8 [Candidatus Saccharibacteria bacterium]